jgi:glycerol-3-phosphate dehydrogenase|tara:strand:- start:7243 stop:8328 length:1086 start_codon:yes stop_codon:yes gene_type:complete
VKIAVVGGGISGLTIAWRLAKQGYSVDLYDAGKVLSRTSASSSKLLHGGIRYLESGHLSLVREALKDRHWWLRNAPHAAKPIEIVIPVFKQSPRSLVTLFMGAKIYEVLAGKYSLGRSNIYGKKKSAKLCSDLNSKGLIGCVTFYDGQMDEQALGRWMLENAKNAGVKIFEDTRINSLSESGEISSSSFGLKVYDAIINAAGPWVDEINGHSEIVSDYSIDLVRGSHLFVNTNQNTPYLFQESVGKRIVFVLPYLGKTLIGTTEVSQVLSEDIKCSDDERDYLLGIYNSHFTRPIGVEDIVSKFSGLRAIVSSGCKDLSVASRESVITINNKLITVFGGKWTSAPSLSQKVLYKLNLVTNN